MSETPKTDQVFQQQPKIRLKVEGETLSSKTFRLKILPFSDAIKKFNIKQPDTLSPFKNWTCLLFRSQLQWG